MRLLFLLTLVIITSCKREKDISTGQSQLNQKDVVSYATGFHISQLDNGIKTIKISSPWPNSESGFVYALIPRDRFGEVKSLAGKVDAVIPIPVERLIVTSTTHVPALEALGVEQKLVGFPETKYISSPKTRTRIEKGKVAELGSNELLNTEMTIALEPDLVVGFGIDGQNKAYRAIESTGIPVVYNGDWTEETPLGKAEWIKFFAPFFGLEARADSIFRAIELNYVESKKLAQSNRQRPTVLSGALYKDVWFLPAGDSWAAKFIADANADYLWKDTEGTGSLNLSLETVLNMADSADFWISPSQFTSYQEMMEANMHYLSFKPFKERKVYTFARTRGATGGLLYYELAPSRPDIVLRDLIYIFHPDLIPDYEPYFFKPLE